MDSTGSDKDNEHQPIQTDGANSDKDDDHQHIQAYKTVTLNVNGVTKQVIIPLKDGASASDYHAVIAHTAEHPFSDESIQATCDPLVSENMGAQTVDVENHGVVGPTTENTLSDESLLSSTPSDPILSENVAQTVDDTETFDPSVQPIVVIPDDTDGDTQEPSPNGGSINLLGNPQETSTSVASSPDNITSNTNSDSIIVIPDEPETPTLAVNRKVTTRTVVVPNKTMAKGSTGQTYYFIQSANGTMLVSANSGQTSVPFAKGVVDNNKATSQLPHNPHRPVKGPFLQVPPEKHAGQNKSLSASTNVTSSTTVTSQSSKSLYVGSDGKMYIQLDPNQVRGFQPQPQVTVVGREDFLSSQSKVQRSMAKTVPPVGTRPNPAVRPVGTTHNPAVRPVGSTPNLAVRPVGTTPNSAVRPVGTPPNATAGIQSILMTNSPKHAVAYQNARSLLPTVLTVPALQQFSPTSVGSSKEVDLYLDAHNQNNDINKQAKGRPLKINAIFSLQPPGSSLQSVPLPNTVNQSATAHYNVNKTQQYMSQNSTDLKNKSGLVTGISSKVSNHPKGKLCRRSSLDSEDDEDGDDFVVLAEWEEDSNKTPAKSHNGEGADQTVTMTLRGTQNDTPTQNIQTPSLGYTINPNSSPAVHPSRGLLTAIRSQLEKHTERSPIHGTSPDSLIPGLGAVAEIADEQVKMTLLHCTSLQQNKTSPPFKNTESQVHSIPQKYKEQYPDLKRLNVTIERLPLPLGKKKMSVRVGKNMQKFEKYVERRHAAERMRRSVMKSKKKAKDTAAKPLTKPQLKQHLNTRYLLVKTNGASYLLPVVLQAPKPGVSSSQASNLNVVPDKALVSLVQQLGASKGESEATKVISTATVHTDGTDQKTLSIKKEPQSEGYGENPKRSRLKRGTESNDIICVDDHDYGDSAHFQSATENDLLYKSTFEKTGTFVDDDTLTTSSTMLLKNVKTGTCDDEASVNIRSSDNLQSPIDIDPFTQTKLPLNEKTGTFDGEDNIGTGSSENEPAEKKPKLDDPVAFEIPPKLSASERVQVLKDLLKQQKKELDKLLTRREESKHELESLDT